MSFSQNESEAPQRFPLHQWAITLMGAIVFYTRIPLPHSWPMSFEGIARYAPLIGLGIGAALLGIDSLLIGIAVPSSTRSGLIVALWLLITGGLHLDGAMDTADGLAVPDEKRRLEVMADSQSGAFGVMVAVVILGLKGLFLNDLESLRWFSVLSATGWSRWGQVVAIARYSYLKTEGKGAFHKAYARPATDWLLGFMTLLILSGIILYFNPACWQFIIGITLSGAAIALLTGAWLNHQLGGHTGDTYGAIVEWTEALVLCVAVVLSSSFLK
ncbi:adenosylcobinamide-GDP ribazoletransferase [Oscillatoria sp. CS-180]|uniref:adenosylcobinamide-GDP ribazoletransferase n=1 Tax=Oscillatoria sp. CS-180 TaxID=3021720 RepID=UPI00232B4CF7|nr:adenosylcobinamide-GDP ribazoletransferase [Oscillatoria sp. CS-180]MDB9525164.1 adenosylcobinamide-GDP ribazoletransferase [Oscillatoria sp. CS-180]